MNEANIIKECFELETLCYPVEEAATEGKIEYRWKNAGEFFLLEKKQEKLVGMLNCTRSHEEEIEEKTMQVSHSNGRFLCIHSVAVLEKERRNGLGSLLLQRIIQVAKNRGDIEKIVLVTKAHLIPFYNKNGFGNITNSFLSHGKDIW